MASTIIDSRIFGDMFSDVRMRDVWSDENRTAKYLDIERALAKVQGELGIIPKDAADEIVRNCNLSQIDWDKLKAKTEQIGYPIIAVVNQINANCRDKLGEYCHWGATTQDITDTAAVMQMREGLALVEQDLDEIAASSRSTMARPSRICRTVAVSVMSCVVAPQWQYSPSLSRHSALSCETTPRIG